MHQHTEVFSTRLNVRAGWGPGGFETSKCSHRVRSTYHAGIDMYVNMLHVSTCVFCASLSRCPFAHISIFIEMTKCPLRMKCFN